MIKRIVLMGLIMVYKMVYGINPYVLKKNEIFYFFEESRGCICTIDYYNSIYELTLDEVLLFLFDFCWGREPTYIFCEDKKVYNGTSSQIKALLASPGRKSINITLQNEASNAHTITCIFPQWPGLDKVSKTAAYDDNRGVMLFPLIPKNPKWYFEMRKVTIYTDFWKKFDNFIIGESYVEKPFVADKPGHLCIALPCLVNYFNDTLSFFCPMKNAGFSLNLQANTVLFSNQLYVDQKPKQYTFSLDIWSPKTQVKGVAVQLFK